MYTENLYLVGGLHEELPIEVYAVESEAMDRFNELQDLYNKALGHVRPRMYREVVETREENWNPETEEWEDE